MFGRKQKESWRSVANRYKTSTEHWKETAERYKEAFIDAATTQKTLQELAEYRRERMEDELVKNHLLSGLLVRLTTPHPENQHNIQGDARVMYATIEDERKRIMDGEWDGRFGKDAREKGIGV